MQISDRPLDEEARLAALRAYGILDTDAERDYDDLTRIAAGIFQVPIAIISLVDADRQWFKSKVGIDATETPRDIAFCAHAILSDQTFLVRDAARDARFADNPLVTGAPFVRFYAGAPLVAPGDLKLGTLCVIDTRPRDPSDEQLDTLGALARQIVNLLELRRASSELAAALSRVRLLSHLIPICAHCGMVRDEQAHWHDLSHFVESHTGAAFSHGICPRCMQEHYGHVIGGDG
ncbi:MAG: GAF domain-containing protein [Planctomycetes bacterium]|nr:GAF domain-containing protein [Planctomycetota bacterium]